MLYPNRHVGETSVAEVQDRDAVSHADSALYGADLAYSILRDLCRLIWLQPKLHGGPRLLPMRPFRLPPPFLCRLGKQLLVRLW